MRKVNSLLCLILFIGTAHGAEFIESTPVYGVIKPGKITTLLAVNHGMVSQILYKVGDTVRRGTTAITVIEKETTRGYRSTLKGSVAKVHVTPGAAVTPGMPLVTILNPKSKVIEVSFSPEEARKVKVGAQVFLRSSQAKFGNIAKISPLVDPDSGGVLSYITPDSPTSEMIGDILPLSIRLRAIKGCKVVSLSDVNKYTSDYSVEAVSGAEACLLSKTKK